ncbi:hypothetical protein CDEF62S_05687 [Castellaniella defragrans]
MPEETLYGSELEKHPVREYGHGRARVRTAWPSAAMAKDLTHITVSVAQANDINGLPWKVAQTKGFFEREGIVLDKVLPAEGGGATLHNVIAGNLPFGQAGDVGACQCPHQGRAHQDHRGRHTGALRNWLGVLKDSPIKTV